MNPFRDWTPEMVEAFNRRQSLGPIAPNLFAKAWGKEFESKAIVPKPRKPLMNKTEARFLGWLKRDHPGQSIHAQNITFRLAHDCRYTPDFWMVSEEEGECVTFWEVKGAFIREDGMIKLKAAAAMFPMFTFILAQWKDGQWWIKTIPPQ